MSYDFFAPDIREQPETAYRHERRLAAARVARHRRMKRLRWRLVLIRRLRRAISRTLGSAHAAAATDMPGVGREEGGADKRDTRFGRFGPEKHKRGQDEQRQKRREPECHAPWRTNARARWAE